MKYQTYDIEYTARITFRRRVRATDEDAAQDAAVDEIERELGKVDCSYDGEVTDVEENTDHPDW